MTGVPVRPCRSPWAASPPGRASTRSTRSASAGSGSVRVAVVRVLLSDGERLLDGTAFPASGGETVELAPSRWRRRGGAVGVVPSTSVTHVRLRPARD